MELPQFIAGSRSIVEIALGSSNVSLDPGLLGVCMSVGVMCAAVDVLFAALRCASFFGRATRGIERPFLVSRTDVRTVAIDVDDISLCLVKEAKRIRDPLQHA